MTSSILIKSKVKQLLNKHSNIRIDLGAGPFHRRGWIGIDLDKDSDIVWNLAKGIPFPDSTVDEIHSEHFFEHLSYPEESGYVFKECYRVLKKGGKISFGVPDIGKIILAYAKGNSEFWKARDWWKPHEWIKTPMDVINWYGLMGGEHKFMYDKETAKERLKEVGFSKVKARNFILGHDYNYRESSLYVEGIK